MRATSNRRSPLTTGTRTTPSMARPRAMMTTPDALVITGRLRITNDPITAADALRTVKTSVNRAAHSTAAPTVTARA